MARTSTAERTLQGPSLASVVALACPTGQPFGNEGTPVRRELSDAGQPVARR